MTPRDERAADRDDEVMAENVRRMRVTSGMSQVRLAAAMVEAGHTHWRQNTVSRIERAEQKLTVGEGKALEAILGGNVTAGTSFAGPIGLTGQAMADGWTRGRARQIEAALEEALRLVREIAYVYNDVPRATDGVLDHHGPEVTAANYLAEAERALGIKRPKEGGNAE